MQISEWRERVGRHVEQRRRVMGFRSVRKAAETAGISEALWRQIESGRKSPMPGVQVVVSPRPDSRFAVARVLGWPDDAIDRLARGEDPDQWSRERMDEARRAQLVHPTEGPPADLSPPGADDIAALTGQLSPENQATVRAIAQALLEQQGRA